MNSTFCLITLIGFGIDYVQDIALITAYKLPIIPALFLSVNHEYNIKIRP